MIFLGSENAEVVFEDEVELEYLWKSELRRIIRILKNLEADMGIVKEKLVRIEENFGITSIAEIDKNVLLKLPLNSVDEIKEFELMLHANDTRKQLLMHLKSTGGSNERNFIFRCLEKLFTNHVAQFCSWTGQKQNYKLAHLKIMEILKDAVKLSWTSIKDTEFEKSVMQWFNHGKTRLLREKSNV